MPPTIPPRNPIGDSFGGSLYESGGHWLLVLGRLNETDPVHPGPLVIRYGVRFLGKLHISIVPGLVALDYGDFLNGEDAWSFLMEKSNRFPRSEVIGYRHDGTDDMVTIKTLDIAVPPMVLAYESDTSTRPLGTPEALISADSLLAEVPARLLNYLPNYPTLAEWQAAITHG